MSRMNTEAYRIALHGLVRQKKFIFAILVSLLPLAAAWLAFMGDKSTMLYAGTWDPYLSDMAWTVILPVALPLMCLLLAGGMIADEAEERTLSYLLVRPIPRTTLYTSRALAVLTVAGPLAFLQVFGLWVLRWISYGLYAPQGARIAISPTESVAAMQVMWVMLPVILGAALLGTVFYTMLFGLASLASTRYHFFINLGYLGLWEGLLGHLPVNAQRLSATHHLGSLIDAADQTANLIWGVAETHFSISVPVLLVVAATAGLASLLVVRYRDFHVTSAAT